MLVRCKETQPKISAVQPLNQRRQWRKHTHTRTHHLQDGNGRYFCFLKVCWVCNPGLQVGLFPVLVLVKPEDFIACIHFLCLFHKPNKQTKEKSKRKAAALGVNHKKKRKGGGAGRRGAGRNNSTQQQHTCTLLSAKKPSIAARSAIAPLSFFGRRREW